MTEAGAMTLDGRELLVQLLDLTPLPTPGLEIEQLVAMFDAILADRAGVIDGIVPPIGLDEADRPLLVELDRRHTLWQDALAAARRVVGEQRLGAEHLRAYAGTP
jgi:hypothetical protein